VSARTVIEHALTVYYDGNAELVGKLLASYDAAKLREAAALVKDRATVADYMESLDYAAALHSVVELLNHKAGAL
jgi:hypothetical protein